jgi:hypothetical protein
VTGHAVSADRVRGRRADERAAALALLYAADVRGMDQPEGRS